MPDDEVSATLAGIRAIEQAATEGPWEMHSHAPSYATRVFDIWHDEQDAYIAQDCLTEADAAFIVTARTAVPRLVAAVEAVLEAAETWRALAGDSASPFDIAIASCAKQVRGRVTAELAGTGKEGSDDE